MINTIENLSQFICTSSGVALAGVGAVSQADTGIINDASAKSQLMHRLDDIERRLRNIENETGYTAGMETKIDMAESAIRDFKRRKRK